MILTFFFWIFVILGPAIYWLFPQAYRTSALSFTSIAFIFYFDPISAVFLIASVFIIDISIRLKNKEKKLSAAILTVFGVLIVINLIIWKLAVAQEHLLSQKFSLDVFLPLGISYFSFKILHFIIEHHQGRITNYQLDIFVIYLFLPTAFSAGPIQRYDRFTQDMKPSFSRSHIIEGVTRIIIGLIKQFVFVSLILNNIFPQFSEHAPLAELYSLETVKIWGFLFVFYLTMYLNFSAYTDIAVGASRLFGFVIMENFNFPILAASINEFWQRWHMTLTGWCRDYIYQPVLGLYRKPVLAAYATFIVVGLWHAFTLNRLIWGLMHGTALIMYFYCKKKGLIGNKSARNKTNVIYSDYSRIAFAWIFTQGFVVFSMAALVVEGNDLLGMFKLILRLFFLI